VTWLRNAVMKIVGLFVDDPTLAGGVAVWIMALGLAAILLLSIVRGAAGTK
jgi:hypothetical protein